MAHLQEVLIIRNEIPLGILQPADNLISYGKHQPFTGQYQQTLDLEGQKLKFACIYNLRIEEDIRTPDRPKQRSDWRFYVGVRSSHRSSLYLPLSSRIGVLLSGAKRIDKQIKHSVQSRVFNQFTSSIRLSKDVNS